MAVPALDHDVKTTAGESLPLRDHPGVGVVEQRGSDRGRARDLTRVHAPKATA